MMIRIPSGLLIAAAVLVTVGTAAMLVQQAPEIARYLKMEGM
jgi:Ca2+/Na+ antiporter